MMCLLLCFLMFWPFAFGDFQSVVIGLKGADFVVVVADATFRRGAVAMEGAHDKITHVSKGQLVATIGDLGEAEDFGEILKQTLKLETLRGSAPTPAMTQHFIRAFAVASRRDRGALPKIKHLFAAVDKTPLLSWLDETGALLDLDYAAHGMGASLVVGFLDRAYEADLTKDQALDLLDQCLSQLHDRYAPSTSAGFLVKILDADGTLHTHTWRYYEDGNKNDKDEGKIPRRRRTTIANKQLKSPLSMRLTTYTSRRHILLEKQ